MAFSQNLLTSFEASPTPHILMEKKIVMVVCEKGYIGIYDGAFHDVLCVPYLSSNIFSIYQTTHNGRVKTVEFAQDLVHIRDSEIGSIVDTRIIYHSFYLYSFSHFVLPSPVLENHSPSSLDPTKVNLGCLNLCGVLETNIVTSTPPPHDQISFVA